MAFSARRTHEESMSMEQLKDRSTTASTGRHAQQVTVCSGWYGIDFRRYSVVPASPERHSLCIDCECMRAQTQGMEHPLADRGKRTPLFISTRPS